jgi:hypothetical protein
MLRHEVDRNHQVLNNADLWKRKVWLFTELSILNIRSENIEICEFEMGICKGCVKSVVYWGNCKILKVSTHIHILELFVFYNSEIQIGDIIYTKIKY